MVGAWGVGAPTTPAREADGGEWSASDPRQQRVGNATTFTLTSTGGSATGTATLMPCVLTVSSSTYPPGGGPQVAEVMALSACISDSNNNTLTVATPVVSVTGSLQ